MATVPLLELTLILFAGVGLFGTTYAARKSAAPFFPTPKNAIRDALRAANLGKGEIFYDLGAGTGRALVIADREFGADARGFEISFIFYAIAKINIFLRGSKAAVRREDLWNADIGDANVIFAFLTERTLKKMGPKLRKELRPGSRIICYGFPLTDSVPSRVIPVRGKWKLFIYAV